ncbi:Carboxypeptidase [Venturia nashicola]|uniref:Carboxypeptidase n=1 Tax=Venturia nashicola TaxID=86259 RepID=A0A4Z1P9I5_9PEZI|nr:Carboxypeptidase [Venturia nashicola]
MNSPRTVKIQCFDERGIPSHALTKFSVHTLSRFSRKGADEQGAKIKNPSNTFEIHVDCSVDIFEMIIKWMRANENKEDVTKWSHIETPRHALSIRQKAKLYQVALFHFKVVRGAEQVRANLVNAIENKQDAFTAEDVQYLKHVLDQDSKLLIEIDKAVAKQFVLGLTHDDEVAKLQAWTGIRKEDTKLGHLVQEYIQALKEAGQEGRIRRHHWKDAQWNFPHINMGQPAPAPSKALIDAAPPKNPWGTVAGKPVASCLFGTSNSTPSLPKEWSIGGSSTAVNPPPKPSLPKPARSSDDLKSLPSKTLAPTSPKKSEWPRLGPSSPPKVALPQINDVASDDAKTETSGYLDSDDSLSTQGRATQKHTIEAWQAAQPPTQLQPSPPRPMTEDEWRTFTSSHITIQKLEETLAHGSLHQSDFDRFYRLYNDLIEVEFWATYTYVSPTSDVVIAKEFAFHKTASRTLYLNGRDDWLVYHAKQSVLGAFMESVGGIGVPIGNLDFNSDAWRVVIHMIVDGHRADLEREARRMG